MFIPTPTWPNFDQLFVWIGAMFGKNNQITSNCMIKLGQLRVIWSNKEKYFVTFGQVSVARKPIINGVAMRLICLLFSILGQSWLSLGNTFAVCRRPSNLVILTSHWFTLTYDENNYYISAKHNEQLKCKCTVQITFIFIDFRVWDFAFAFKT